MLTDEINAAYIRGYEAGKVWSDDRIREMEAQVESLQNKWANRPLSNYDCEALIAHNEKLEAALREIGRHCTQGDPALALASIVRIVDSALETSAEPAAEPFEPWVEMSDVEETACESPWVTTKKEAIEPTAEAADAFWKYWRENGETHKHGYYESTWGAINAALNAHSLTGQVSNE